MKEEVKAVILIDRPTDENIFSLQTLHLNLSPFFFLFFLSLRWLMNKHCHGASSALLPSSRTVKWSHPGRTPRPWWEALIECSSTTQQSSLRELGLIDGRPTPVSWNPAAARRRLCPPDKWAGPTSEGPGPVEVSIDLLFAFSFH